jgi:hypothetical protein
MSQQMQIFRLLDVYVERPAAIRGEPAAYRSAVCGTFPVYTEPMQKGLYVKLLSLQNGMPKRCRPVSRPCTMWKRPSHIESRSLRTRLLFLCPGNRNIPVPFQGGTCTTSPSFTFVSGKIQPKTLMVMSSSKLPSVVMESRQDSPAPIDEEESFLPQHYWRSRPATRWNSYIVILLLVISILLNVFTLFQQQKQDLDATCSVYTSQAREYYSRRFTHANPYTLFRQGRI